MIKGKLDTKLFDEYFNGSILAKLVVIEGVCSLSDKKTVAIAILRYAEHRTPINEEIARVPTDLGRDNGNKISKLEAIPQINYPVSLSPNHFFNSSLSK